MSPYRVPAPPPVEPAPRKLWPAAAFGAVVGLLASAGVAEGWRAARVSAEVESQRAAIEAAERNASASKRSYPVPGTSAEERAELEAQLEAAKRKRQERVELRAAIKGQRAGPFRAFRTDPTLPKCKCAAGDPLCSEIPGATCRP